VFLNKEGCINSVFPASVISNGSKLDCGLRGSGFSKSIFAISFKVSQSHLNARDGDILYFS